MANPATEAAVMSGMELITWKYAPGEWNKYLKAASGLRWTRKGVRTALWQTGLILTPVAGLSWLFTTSVLATGVFTGLVAVAAGMVARGSTDPVLKDVDDAEPHEVRFTSTGVIIGDEARLWRAKRTRLVSAHIEPRGWPVLLLGFSGMTRTLKIPIPPDRRDDVQGLLEWLAGKARGMDGAGTDVEAPRPRD